jgi:multisubunit Na+/H+ antiporter MnhE subunit
MSPTAAKNLAAQITLTPGTLISRRASEHDSA